MRRLKSAADSQSRQGSWTLALAIDYCQGSRHDKGRAASRHAHGRCPRGSRSSSSTRGGSSSTYCVSKAEWGLPAQLHAPAGPAGCVRSPWASCMHYGTHCPGVLMSADSSQCMLACRPYGCCGVREVVSRWQQAGQRFSGQDGQDLGPIRLRLPAHPGGPHQGWPPCQHAVDGKCRIK